MIHLTERRAELVEAHKSLSNQRVQIAAELLRIEGQVRLIDDLLADDSRAEGPELETVGLTDGG